MKKIRIQNIKTGKVSEVTEMAWRVIKRGNQGKFFDLLEKPESKITFAAPKVETPKHIFVESPEIQEIPQPVDEPKTESAESIQETPPMKTENKPATKTVKKKGRKPKN